jgi:hypothetical protein
MASKIAHVAAHARPAAHSCCAPVLKSLRLARDVSLLKMMLSEGELGGAHVERPQAHAVLGM